MIHGLNHFLIYRATWPHRWSRPLNKNTKLLKKRRTFRKREGVSFKKSNKSQGQRPNGPVFACVVNGVYFVTPPRTHVNTARHVTTVGDPKAQEEIKSMILLCMQLFGTLARLIRGHKSFKRTLVYYNCTCSHAPVPPSLAITGVP